ncbi:MAG: ABC transporter substrate-binding protein [Nitrospina sp.]|jgi:phospholipid transport system substrate-binding protein|nr:ABC transporter substrate-binding protein [Nitrospina sp.]MBT5633560.1 ABC transporter substrate-binding protein [Nitrospina sp.]
MNRKYISAYILFAVSLFLVSGQVFAESQITADLKGTIDQVLEIVSDKNLQKNPPLRREKLRKVIALRFNYRQMVMRSLAKNFKDRSDQEREEFTDLFKQLLENSYASKIENYQDETINYVGEQVKGQYAMVKTQIVRKDGVVDVDYKLLKENGQWLVYDFVIEGVSLIRNYRSQFSKIISTESYAALVSKLTKKINDLEINSKAEAENL